MVLCTYLTVCINSVVEGDPNILVGETIFHVPGVHSSRINGSRSRVEQICYSWPKVDIAAVVYVLPDF